MCIYSDIDGIDVLNVGSCYESFLAYTCIYLQKDSRAKPVYQMKTGAHRPGPQTIKKGKWLELKSSSKKNNFYLGASIHWRFHPHGLLQSDWGLTILFIGIERVSLSPRAWDLSLMF